MWILLAFGSALFAGLTSILAKCGIQKTDSSVATALRTIVVLLFSWLMVFVSGAEHNFAAIPASAWCFLILSGLATGASWLCYFRALQLGEVSRVAAIDKSSTVLTILLALILLREPVTVYTAVALVLIGAGTYLMTQPAARGGAPVRSAWLIYALLSALFASLTAILSKVGLQKIDSTFGTAIRTGVVLIMAWVVVFVTGKQHRLRDVSPRELRFILLSGLATGASWLCYYKALKDGQASVVVPIDKLSILVTTAFSCLFLKERLYKRSWLGLGLITGGTLLMLL